jgi:hypothetical protein
VIASTADEAAYRHAAPYSTRQSVFRRNKQKKKKNNDETHEVYQLRILR